MMMATALRRMVSLAPTGRLTAARGLTTPASRFQAVATGEVGEQGFEVYYVDVDQANQKVTC